ncbi:MAG: AEC family transporter [Beijerinckiaceae bacterium]|jgi:malonate transporter and related proteins|nr:AEC family transporter [Beijerinckiaceae bacterium]
MADFALGAVLNIVLPVFAIIAAGYLCGRRGLLGDDASLALNQFVYWVALPALLFKAMAEIQADAIIRPGFIAGFVLAIIVIWLLSLVVALRVFRLDLAQATLYGMNGVYGNSGYLGIPLALTAFGQAAVLPAIIVTVINTAVVVGIAIILLESNRSADTALPKIAGSAALAMTKNPMLTAPFLGLLYAMTGFPLPAALSAFTGLLGAAAGPCALFSIGLFMVGKPLSDGRSEVAAMTVTKLLVHPALTALVLLALFPVNSLWAKVAILMAALPTGTGSFVLAQSYGHYILRTSSAILVTTVLSVGSLSIFFYIFPPGIP